MTRIRGILSARMAAFAAAAAFAMSGAAAPTSSALSGDGANRWFSNWPADADPAAVSRKIAEQFLSTLPDRYRPENGYRGNDGYGGGVNVHYAVVSLWMNALECARLSGDAWLESRLIAAFEPFHGVKKDRQPSFKHVDYTIFGAVPLEIAILDGDDRAKTLGLKFADMQWEEPKPDDPPPCKNIIPFERRLELWRSG